MKSYEEREKHLKQCLFSAQMFLKEYKKSKEPQK